MSFVSPDMDFETLADNGVTLTDMVGDVSVRN